MKGSEGEKKPREKIKNKIQRGERDRERGGKSDRHRETDRKLLINK